MENTKFTTVVAHDGNYPDPLESAPGVPVYSVEALVSKQLDPAVKRTVDTLNTVINETRRND